MLFYIWILLFHDISTETILIAVVLFLDLVLDLEHWYNEEEEEKEEELFICHIYNYTEYDQQGNVFSAFNPSKCKHTWSRGQPTLRRPGTWCLVQGSHLSLGQFLPEPRFKTTTSGYKSDALCIRATTAPQCELKDEIHPTLQIKRHNKYIYLKCSDICVYM